MERRTTNIALNRFAIQSSTARGGPASHAVDGNDSPLYGSSSCTHTAQESDPWWRVDLGTSQSVGRVVVTNRKDCCSERLEGFTVYVGDSPELLSNPTCGGQQSVGGKDVITVNCGGLTGRYVGIALSGSERYLTLCEVEVFEAVECPENSAYSICTSACPATCVNPNAPDDCNLPCVEGCECELGYVQSGQECVLQANCGCIDEDGFYRIVDGLLNSVPFSRAGGMIDVSYLGTWVHVQLTEFCVDIYYNGLYHCVKVKVTPYYWDRMCGLCGNYNGNMGDDFMMSDLVTIAPNWNVFGHDWLVEDEDDERCGGRLAPTPDPVCPAGLMTVVSGTGSCGLIKDTNGPFADCQAVVDPKDFFEDCVFDMCAQNGDTEALCESLGAYADACEDAGVKITWRSATICPMTCPPNSHYNPCASPCPPTCQEPKPVCIQVCVECCECDDGYIMSGRHCVTKKECGCTDTTTGRYYELDETWVEDGKRCVCKENNNINCTGQTPA
ncbi:ZAN [Branchiostoma lanceolatum]|uniref:ZAN protein n=1 Tax=Branchiostoma lanceolatum TaxID=7740 RepID=A0A8K0ACH8_BRALA|nr:ZAN [Branchiostoma lanceolatum]